MDDERAQVSNVCGNRCVFQVVDELESLFLGARVNRDDSTAFAAELLLDQVVVRALLECGVVNFDAFETLQKFCELQGVATQTLHAKSQSFESEGVQECGRRGDTTTHVTPDAVA